MRHAALAALVLCVALPPALHAQQAPPGDGHRLHNLREPVSVYNNWSAYDELADPVEIVLTEELALRELKEIVRLRQSGVRFDYYLMDAYWFAPGGGYRTWRKPNWPDGPDRWLAECKKHGIKPGLWVAVNSLSHMEPVPEWAGSFNRERTAMCLFEGPFLGHFMESLQLWYGRGVRLFKFDFANFGAATPETARTLPVAEIRSRNEAALRAALLGFRLRNPEVVLQAYNGFGGKVSNTTLPHRLSVDTRWLDVFDSLYSGDPRPADVPTANFYRSMDIYSDHTVRRYEQYGVPLERIDSCSFMMGNTSTCFWRGKTGWKGMLLLNLARGGWMNVYYGNLELLTAEDARWFAKAQSLFFRLQGLGRTFTFGGMPGRRQGYGFASVDAIGALYTAVNPTQEAISIPLPLASRLQPALSGGRILFRDAGFEPRLSDSIRLGPEQMAVVGFGRYAAPEYDLGVQRDIAIPSAIEPLAPRAVERQEKSTTVRIAAPRGGRVRILMQQFDESGLAKRNNGGPKGKRVPIGQVLRIEARQGGRVLPLEGQYQRKAWAGLSWMAAEIPAGAFSPGAEIAVACSTGDEAKVRLEVQTYNTR